MFLASQGIHRITRQYDDAMQLNGTSVTSVTTINSSKARND
jgi:hypothetical protein